MSEIPLYPPLQRTPLETACSRHLNPEMCTGMSTSGRRAKTDSDLSVRCRVRSCSGPVQTQLNAAVWAGFNAADMCAAVEQERTTVKVVEPGPDSIPDGLIVCEIARQQLSSTSMKSSSYNQVYSRSFTTLGRFLEESSSLLVRPDQP